MTNEERYDAAVAKAKADFAKNWYGNPYPAGTMEHDAYDIEFSKLDEAAYEAAPFKILPVGEYE